MPVLLRSTGALITAALLTGCVTGPVAVPQASAADTAARDAYIDCVYRKASETALLPEPAETLAAAATANCSRQYAELLEAAIAHVGIETGTAAARLVRNGTRDAVVGLIINRRRSAGMR